MINFRVISDAPIISKNTLKTKSYDYVFTDPASAFRPIRMLDQGFDQVSGLPGNGSFPVAARLHQFILDDERSARLFWVKSLP